VTIIKKNLHKIKTLFRSDEDSQPISSAKSYVTTQATSEDISKSKKIKENEKVTVNSSTSEKAVTHNKTKEVYSNDWLVTTSDCAIHAEECTQNKDKFDANWGKLRKLLFMQ